MNKFITTTSAHFLAATGGASQGAYGAFIAAGFIDPDDKYQYIDEVIVISDRLITGLTNDEFQAIYLHEKGHIVHEHTRKTMEASLSSIAVAGGVQIMTTAAFELEADAYASVRVGGATVARALRKLMSITFSDHALIQRAISKGFDEAGAITYLNGAMAVGIAALQPRFDALLARGD